MDISVVPLCARMPEENQIVSTLLPLSFKKQLQIKVKKNLWFVFFKLMKIHVSKCLCTRVQSEYHAHNSKSLSFLVKLVRNDLELIPGAPYVVRPARRRSYLDFEK